jgi:type II secretory pathway pseudopilin PulG
LDSLQLTAIDKALLQQTAAHKRTSKASSFRIALLGGSAEAAKVDPDIVQTRQAAGRALRALYEAQGFKKPRATKAQKKARQQRQVERARRTFQAALDSRATSNQDRVFNALVDAPPTLAPINVPTANHANWRNRDGVLRDRSGAAAKRQARDNVKRRNDTAPQLPAPAPTSSLPPASPPASANSAAPEAAPEEEEILDCDAE